jgi:nucleoside-diphosphate-sugar epimerase
VIFGYKDILLNIIGYLLGRSPFFAIPGSGNFRIQPVFVEDLANLAIEAAHRIENLMIDAVGPETFTFNETVALIANAVGSHSWIIRLPPTFTLTCAWLLGRAMGDVVLTSDEIRGPTANLLVSSAPPTAPTRFSEWLQHHAGLFGTHYASEIARR